METIKENSLEYPLEIRDVEPEEEARFMKVFSDMIKGFSSNNSMLNEKKTNSIELTKSFKFAVPNLKKAGTNVQLNIEELNLVNPTVFLALDSRLQWSYYVCDLSNELSSFTYAVQRMHRLTYVETAGLVVGPKGYFLPKNFKQQALNIYNLALRPTDVFVISYPRSGTTLTQELVWMIVNNLDYETSNTVPLTERYPFLEFSVFMQPVMKQQFQDEINDEDKLKILENMTKPGPAIIAQAPSPRFVKSHLPLSLLPPSLLDIAKVIYVARDPRDVVVSFYHLHKVVRTQGYIGDFKTYWEFFINDLHYWTPYFEHLKESWEMRHHPNLLFLFYEEMNKDLPAAVRRIADFFGKKFSESEIYQLCNHLSIDNFKQNKSVNYDVMRELGILQGEKESFIRKGKAGGWRDYFDEEMAAQAEQWIEENLKNTDLRFPHLQ